MSAQIQGVQLCCANSGFFISDSSQKKTPAPTENFQLRQICENSKFNGNFKVEVLSFCTVFVASLIFLRQNTPDKNACQSANMLQFL